MRTLTSELFKQSCYRPGGDGGAKEDRTPDLLRAKQALSQLSYGPIVLTGHAP